MHSLCVIAVQLLSCVQLFVIPWTAAHQAFLFITNFWSLLQLTSIELVMHPTISSSVASISSSRQSFPASGSFPMRQNRMVRLIDGASFFTRHDRRSNSIWLCKRDKCIWASQMVVVVKNPPTKAADARDAGLIPGSGRSSGKGNGNDSSILAWKIPWTDVSGGL